MIVADVCLVVVAYVADGCREASGGVVADVRLFLFRRREGPLGARPRKQRVRGLHLAVCSLR